jgi:hypothetical protein
VLARVVWEDHIKEEGLDLGHGGLTRFEYSVERGELVETSFADEEVSGSN